MRLGPSLGTVYRHGGSVLSGPTLAGQRAVTAMANTGDVNIVAGLYACAECGKRISVAKGRTFPRCLVCVKSTAYDLLTPTE
jgi:LRP1 type putative zinc finger protein